MGYDARRTNEDFARALTALRTSAREFGVDVNDEAVAAWLRHHAECVAEDVAQLRHAYTLLNRGLSGDG